MEYRTLLSSQLYSSHRISGIQLFHLTQYTQDMGELKSSVRRNHRKASDITKLLQDTSLSERPVEPSFQKVDRGQLSVWRGAPPSSNLVLFTPAIPSTSDIDPFEPLGRALSAYHGQVRHVPYLPTRGMTTTHSTFCSVAGSIVIVACQIIEGYGPISSASLRGQQHAVRDIRDVALANQIPIVLIEIGAVDCGHLFSTVIQCGGYTAGMLEMVTRLVFYG